MVKTSDDGSSGSDSGGSGSGSGGDGGKPAPGRKNEDQLKAENRFFILFFVFACFLLSLFFFRFCFSRFRFLFYVVFCFSSFCCELSSRPKNRFDSVTAG